MSHTDVSAIWAAGHGLWALTSENGAGDGSRLELPPLGARAICTAVPAHPHSKQLATNNYILHLVNTTTLDNGIFHLVLRMATLDAILSVLLQEPESSNSNVLYREWILFSKSNQHCLRIQ